MQEPSSRNSLPRAGETTGQGRRRRAIGIFMLGSAVCLLGSLARSAGSTQADPEDGGDGDSTLEETRLLMGKWIETQQIISKERNDWQQGKEILVSRLELVKKEVSTLEEKIQQAEAAVAEAERRRGELLVLDEGLVADLARLNEAVSGMETRVGRLTQTLPEPIRAKLDPLLQRIPEDPATAKVSAAERFQNVLGILNEVNKANSELSVNYEVRTLADGKPSEVRTIYVGLAQGYYVSASGEAGIGSPGADGWTWTASNAVADDVVTALEILQGKHTPAFVPLPVKIQ